MRFGSSGRGRASRTRSRLTVGSAPRGWLSSLVPPVYEGAFRTPGRATAPSVGRGCSARRRRPRRAVPCHLAGPVVGSALISSRTASILHPGPCRRRDRRFRSPARRPAPRSKGCACDAAPVTCHAKERDGREGRAATRVARGGGSVAPAAGARAGPPPSVCAAGAPRRDPTPRGRRLGTAAWEGRGACRDRRGNLPERFDLTLHYVWIFFPSLFLFFWKYFRNKVTSFSSIKVYILTTG